jgi:hypothetical protein
MSPAWLTALLLAAPAVDVPRSEGWVVLPVSDYRDLRAKAYPPSPPPDPLAFAALLTRVEYDLKVAGDAATGRARLHVDVLREGWVRVPAPAGLLVREARLDGRPLPLLDGDPKQPAPEALLSRTGRAVLDLDVVIPVVSAAGTESITVPQSTAAVTQVTLTLPRKEVDLQAPGGLLLERSDGEVSRFVAHGRTSAPWTLSWRRKVDDQRALVPLRLRAIVTELVGLAEESAQVTAQVELEAVQGQADRVRLVLPEGLAVNQVSGPLVADWETSGNALAVRFLEPLRDRTSLVIAGEARCPREGRIDAPLVRVAGAERETGGIALEVLGAGEIRRQDTRGLEPADPSDLGGMVAGRDSPSLVAFRLRPLDAQAPRALTVDLVRYTPEAILVANVDEAHYRALLSEDGKALVQGRYAVRNNQRAFLAVTLPPGAVLWSASVAGRAVRPGHGPDGTLLLPMLKGKAGEEAPAFVIEMAYLARADAWTERGRQQVLLPALDLPVSRTGMALHHSPRFRVGLLTGAFREEAGAVPVSALLTAAADASVPLAGQDEERASTLKDADVGVAAEQKELIERFQEGRARRVAGVTPVEVPFPTVGPALYVVGELTAEGSVPVVELSYKRESR